MPLFYDILLTIAVLLYKPIISVILKRATVYCVPTQLDLSADAQLKYLLHVRLFLVLSMTRGVNPMGF